MFWDRQSLRYRNGAIEAPGGGRPAGNRRIVLLVHGYNNDKADADASYDALVRHLTADVGAAADNVWRFYWPSYVERLTGRLVDEPTSVSSGRDTAGTESNAPLSAATYPLQVLKAREVGAALGRYLADVRVTAALPTEIVFVAHSLGCRVVLEAIQELLGLGEPELVRQRLPGVCLMAAAVPTFMVEGTGTAMVEGTTAARLRGAATAPQATYVLHSNADMVLRFAFPAGQGAASALLRRSSQDPADTEGLFPEAVGRHGNPTTSWLRRGDTGLGHSGYWTHPSTAPAVLRALRGATAAELRTLPTLQQVSWSLPAPPELPDWKIRDSMGRVSPRR